MIIRLPYLSARIPSRALWSVIALFVVLMISSLTAVWLGVFPVSIQSILNAVFGSDRTDPIERMIIVDSRLPRILVAIGAGAAFGLGGAMFQTMLRNPLASPDVIGFSAGASCGALAALILTGGFVLPGAIVGGLATAFAVTLLAWKGGLHPYRLILIGIGASLVLSALADLLMSRLDAKVAADMAKWLIGTLNARDWNDVRLVWIGLLILMPLALWLQFPLARLAMSDDTATGLGVALTPARLTITATGVGLVALAVSVAGPLPFVAFVAGPIARRLVKGGVRRFLAAAVVGALVVLLADTLARMVPVVQLPAGAFTALIGAPVLMWLLVVQFRKGTL